MYIWVYNKSKEMRVVLQCCYFLLGFIELYGYVDQRQFYQCDCRNDCYWFNKFQQLVQQICGINQNLCQRCQYDFILNLNKNIFIVKLCVFGYGKKNYLVFCKMWMLVFVLVWQFRFLGLLEKMLVVVRILYIIQDNSIVRII